MGGVSSGNALPRWAAALAIGALVIVAVLAVVLAQFRTSPPPVDQWWMGVIGKIRAPAFDAVALTLNVVGAGLVGRILIPAVVIVVLLLRRRMAEAFYFLVAVVSSDVIVDLLKNLVARDRPPNGLVPTASAAFPSGHSATAAVLTVALALIIRRLWFWVLAVGYTVGMMASRSYLGVHWLTDTIAGALLGAALAVLLYFALQWYLEQTARDADAG